MINENMLALLKGDKGDNGETTVKVGGVEQGVVEFDSDPQEQLDKRIKRKNADAVLSQGKWYKLFQFANQTAYNTSGLIKINSLWQYSAGSSWIIAFSKQGSKSTCEFTVLSCSTSATSEFKLRYDPENSVVEFRNGQYSNNKFSVEISYFTSEDKDGIDFIFDGTESSASTTNSEIDITKGINTTGNIYQKDAPCLPLTSEIVWTGNGQNDSLMVDGAGWYILGADSNILSGLIYYDGGANRRYPAPVFTSNDSPTAFVIDNNTLSIRTAVNALAGVSSVRYCKLS